MSQKPVFSFIHVDRVTDEPWKFSVGDHGPELLAFLCDMSRQDWAAIGQMRSEGRAKHHGQPIEGIKREAQKDLRRARLDEVFGDEIFRFRLGNRKRLWGFREGAVFHVVWWDPRHKVYPTEPSS